MGRVFISYRHESPEHAAAVADLARRLQHEGIEVVLDQFELAGAFRGGGPDEGWDQWCVRRAKEEPRVLAICSEGWLQRYDGHDAGGVGLGCAAEIHVLKRRLYEAGHLNDFFRLVELGARPTTPIPMELRTFHRFDASDIDNMVKWLRPNGAGEVVVPQWPEAWAFKTWPVANHETVRDASAALLAQGSRHRILGLQGDTATGKTTLTKRIVASAAAEGRVHAGRLDLKGTSGLGEALQRFAMELGATTASGESDGARLAGIADQLTRRAEPTLIVLDTYEAAGDLGSWIETTILFAVLRRPWLRVVVAGQRLPDRSHAPWSEWARWLPIVQPNARDWWELSQRVGRNHEQAYIERVYADVSGRPDVMLAIAGAREHP